MQVYFKTNIMPDLVSVKAVIYSDMIYDPVGNISKILQIWLVFIKARNHEKNHIALNIKSLCRSAFTV